MTFQELQLKYTLGSQIGTNPYHISVVRGKLTRSIPELVPALHDEVVEAFSQHIPPTDGATYYFHLAARTIN